MAIDQKMICPMMQRQCIEDGALVNGELHSCRFWIHVMGKDPQSGINKDLWDCAFAWMPVLLIENSNQQRETGAEINKLRNEIVPPVNMTNGIMAQMLSGFNGTARLIGDVDGNHTAAN